MKKLVLKLNIILVVFFLGISITNAASFKVSVGSRSLSKGTTTNLVIKGTDVTGRFNISSSNSSVVSIGDDRVWIENDSVTIKLSALSVGTSTITITPSGVSDSNGNAANLSAQTIKITVSLPREKSTDNTLSSLSVEGYDISPSFDKDTLDYSVSVPEGTKSININASATSKYASITGNGTKEVVEGINNLSIVVKSESGTERIYNLVVNVIDENPINVKVDNINYTVIKLRSNFTCPDLFSESEVVIDNIPIPACTNELIDYTLVGLKQEDGTIVSFRYLDNKYIKYNELSSNNIKLINEEYDGKIKGLQETKISINDVEYQAFKFSDKSKYFVIYGVNVSTGEKGLFVYDSVNKTFSGYDSEYIDYLTKQNETYLYIIVAFGAGLFLAIICILLLNKNKKKVRLEKKKDNIDNDKKKVKNKKNKSQLEENNKDTEEMKDENFIEEKKDNEDIEEKTDTYYLFDSDKKKKHKK